MHYSQYPITTLDAVNISPLIYPLWAVQPAQSLRIAIPLLPLWAVRPVQSLSIAIPLLPLWAVRPVQNLSRAIPLLPLWAVQPVQSLSSSTRLHITFLTYHNTNCVVTCRPVAGRTAISIGVSDHVLPHTRSTVRL